MTFSDWAPPAATVLGAGLAYFGARAGLGQRHRADLRAEWRERFALALTELAANNPERRVTGRTIMRHLSRSDLGTPEDRALAATISKRALERDSNSPSTSPRPRCDLDEPSGDGHTGHEPDEGGSR